MTAAVLRAHREIVLVLALFAALGSLYSVTTPLFEAPDEQWHFAFVQYVATGRGLPVQADPPAHLARQEGSQPPLYYLLAAAATFWIDTSDYPGIVWENPHYGYNVPGIVNDNKNLFIHTALESFPYRGAVLAIHLARLVSVLMGALAVYFTYRLTLEIFPERKFLAASAGAVVGFVPQFLFVSSAVSNDSTIVALSALSLWLMARVLTVDGRRKTDAQFPSSVLGLRSVIALGIATGLASLAKVSGAGLVVLAATVLVYVYRRDWKKLVSQFIIFGAVVFIVAGWWYLRNLFLYGELTGTAMMTRIFGGRETPLTAAQLLTQLREVWETFWVGFGWGNVRAQPVVYAFIAAVALISMVGLVRLSIIDYRLSITAHSSDQDLNRKSGMLILAGWLVVVFVELLNWMETTQAPHGRLFFPALPALAPLLVLGITQWVPRHIEPILARVPALMLFIFAALAPLAILQPAYAYPPTLNAEPNPAHRVDMTYGDQVKLLGYDVSSERALPGDAIQLTLYWQSLAPMDTDYSIGIHLVDTGRRVISARDSYPGHGMLPTNLWRAGQMIADTYWVPISVEASAPSVAQIQVDLYERISKRDLTARDPAGQAVTPFIGRVKIAPVSYGAPRAQNATHFVFGREIELLGYDVNSQGLTLYWKRTAPITHDYVVFVHALDANGEILVQQDRVPQEPPTLWDGGETVVDAYALDLGMARQLEIGLYRPDTHTRLSVSDAQENEIGDHVTLGVGR